MGFKCKNCGSNLRYNIEKRKLECESCGSIFEALKYDSASSTDVLFKEFHCKNCGAGLYAMDEEQSVFCSYCGSQAFLNEKTQGLEAPKKIIPFKLTKKKVKEKYKEQLKGQFFLPKEFLEESFMEEFRGIYIPYWQTSVDIEEKELEFKGIKNYTKGEYDYHEKYDMSIRFQGNIKTGSNDASYYFDDTIANSIAPFKMSDQVDFKEGYLAGFYADKVTVANDIYLDNSKDIAIKCLEKKLTNSSSVTINDTSWKRKLNIQPKTDGVSLFPVWFLTWRKKDRVAYAVMNGQTGKMITDLPVDYKAFFKYVGLLTAVLFLLLSILPIFVLPLRLAGLSGLLMWLSIYLLYLEVKKIGWIESHKFDYGFTGKKKRPIKKSLRIILQIIMWAIMFIAACIGLFSEVPEDLADTTTILNTMNIIFYGLILINVIRLKNKLIVFTTVIGIVGSIASNSLALLMDPHDYMNYIIAFICLGVMVINALTSMYYINYLTTRPVPNFFNREGANHKYEAD